MSFLARFRILPKIFSIILFGQQISGIQAATQESVTAIQTISGTNERLSEISSTIAAAVEEQGAATQEISRNVQQAAQGTQLVSSNITDVQRGKSIVKI